MWTATERLILKQSMAVVAVGAATLFTWLLWRHLEPAITPLFLVAVTISGWVGGLRSALVAVVLSVLGAGTLAVALDWPGQLGWQSVIWTASFLLVGLLAGALNASRRRAEQLLRERDLRLKLVSDQIPAGVWSADSELHLTSMFGAGLPLLSAPAGPVTVADAFGQATGEGTRLAEQAHRDALKGQPGSYELERDGRTYQSHVEPLHGPEGQIIGVVGVALDITARKKAEDRLKHAWNRDRQAKQEAEAASSAKDQFLAMLSHELRTPLTPALLATSALEQRGDLPAGVRRDVLLIQRNIELEAVLIDDLLDLTRVSRGKLELHLEVVDSHAILGRALDICRQDIDRKRLDVHLELSAPHHLVLADVARLQQVFWNLLKNAAKFSPEGGQITIRSRNEGSRRDDQPLASVEPTGPDPFVIIEVIDSGVGIEAEYLEKVFQPFEQTDAATSRKLGGLGLGLAISKALVTAHGGDIWAQSAGRDQGSTFTVRLEAAASLPTESRVEPAPHAATGRHLKILLVEDHADTRRLLGRALRRLGHDIHTADSVAAALRSMDRDPAELLVSDLSLPDGSGLELMEQLRRRQPAAGLKGIAVSGYGMEDDIRRCHEAGFSRHLTKPISLQQLQETIEQVALL